MTLVVDSSVASKWVLPEKDSARAARLHDVPDEFIAPTLIQAEIGNAIWKRVLWRELSPGDANEALAMATALLNRFVPMEDLTTRALSIACALDHPIYDCFYLALAEREQCPCITADKRLLEAAKGLKSVEMRAL